MPDANKRWCSVGPNRTDDGDYSNSLSAIGAAEFLRRIVMHRESPKELQVVSSPHTHPLSAKDATLWHYAPTKTSQSRHKRAVHTTLFLRRTLAAVLLRLNCSHRWLNCRPPPLLVSWCGSCLCTGPWSCVGRCRDAAARCQPHHAVPCRSAPLGRNVRRHVHLPSTQRGRREVCAVRGTVAHLLQAWSWVRSVACAWC